MSGLDGGRLNIAASRWARRNRRSTRRSPIWANASLRQTHRPVPGAAVPAGRHGDRTAGGADLPRQAASKLDRKAPDATKFCAMAKRFVTDTAFNVANDALQLHGGYGYLADYGVEKIVRDLRVHQILEGTNEIMRVIVSRALLAERAA
jgi:alkylation response protein AidB-like acyl-CoA dehydrogenase